jgi:hypothetical protein
VRIPGVEIRKTKMFNDTTTITEMMVSSIEFCAEKTGPKGRDQIVEARARGDCSVCEYLRYGLAKGVAEHLGPLDETIKAIYIYEPEAPTTDGCIPDRPSLSPGISMIIWASRRTADLASLVTSARLAVDEELCQLSCPKANELCNMLDVTVVDDKEVQERTGYGALIGSLYAPPLEIWRR